MNTNVIREMESEASMRCEVQTKTIADLVAEIKQQLETIVALQKRCFQQSYGYMCVFCDMSKTCKHGSTY